MAGPTGLEPATSGVTGRRSSRLNYDPASKQTLGDHMSGDFNPSKEGADGGRRRCRTSDPLLVRQVLSR